ncbi:hypothetical protein EDD22DRAFT_867904 [Suillus occidentalis]|nr:hypothetical protein EDD22DRAFT_867904 [Suillus occidentalis]
MRPSITGLLALLIIVFNYYESSQHDTQRGTMIKSHCHRVRGLVVTALPSVSLVRRSPHEPNLKDEFFASEQAPQARFNLY